MSVVLAIAIVLTPVTPPKSATATDRFVVIGQGLRSCGEWSSARKENGWLYIAKLAWLGGFLSGLNSILSVTAGKGNLLDGSDMDGAIGWIDNYCAANPLENLGDASRALAMHLMNRSMRKP